MNKTELQNLQNKMGFRPGKSLGQNFLVDENFLEFIIRCADPQKDEAILEIGPGFGSLTTKLLEAGARVTAVEMDKKLSAYLKDTVKSPNFRLIEGDACKISPSEIFKGEKSYRCVSNMPYSCSGVFAANIFKSAFPPSEMLLMLQKEMAQRLASEPGCGEYGSLSICAQNSYDVKIIRSIPPEVFSPKPAVESALAKFSAKENPPSQRLRAKISNITRIVFSHRRKKMHNVLKSSFGEEPTAKAYEALGIDRDIRPERVSPETFLKLAEFYEGFNERTEQSQALQVS